MSFPDTALQRRARPLLGTLVEVGGPGLGIEAAFEAVARVQSRMSRFDAASDIGRFNAMAAPGLIEIDPWTAEVLGAAAELQQASAGLFDISLGSGPGGWRCEGLRLHKLAPQVQLDLGGIAKGFAVDRAVDALRSQGARSGWVNAGGDLRVFGDIELPIRLRDEGEGGVREFGSLADGALATSRFGADARSRAWHPSLDVRAHVSVVAPACLWADALTKLIAVAGRADHALLHRHGARAWLH
jgi:thiamine biosynthesis lipoprotein